VDVNGDGTVGPQEVIDLSQNWKGPALPLGGAQPWQVDGANIFYNVGNVGIATATPQAKLHVEGTSWFQGDNTPLPAAAGKGIAVGFAGEQGYIFGFDYSTFEPKNLLLQNPGGNVGIGTLSPSGGRLHVDGASSTAVYGTSTGGVGLFGQSTSSDGVYGYSSSGSGVDGRSGSLIGVYGLSYSTFSAGVYGTSPYIGVEGISTGTDANRQAVRGDNAGSATGYAGLFYGNTWVVGTLTKNGGSFKIDHPLDPANKYLSHSFVESPEMMNIYNGNVVTDAKGYATITLPVWFEALNKEFRYQLTVIDGADSDQFVLAKVVKEIKGNQFTIRSSQPEVKVSWQVTGIRQDEWANAHRIVVEEEKPADQRGKYLTPEVHGQPKEMGIHYRPEMKRASETASKVE
jgi:hypothetical protein